MPPAIPDSIIFVLVLGAIVIGSVAQAIRRRNRQPSFKILRFGAIHTWTREPISYWLDSDGLWNGFTEARQRPDAPEPIGSGRPFNWRTRVPARLLGDA